jgi:hypothetical protein
MVSSGVNVTLFTGSIFSVCMVFRHVCKIANSDYELCHVHQPARLHGMTLDSHWMDFDEFGI